jgi:phosphate transport system substrate-binding protein
MLAALATVACGVTGGAPRVIIQNKGSDTLLYVAQAWAEAYKEVDPTVAVAVSGGGSGTGISALINGTVDVANSSRQIGEDEIAAARRNGNDPVEFVVGYDALAILVHPSNPVAELALEDVAEIFGEHGAIDRWSQIGITVPRCPSDEIVRVSRQNNSGTYEYFREAVLGEGDFRMGSRDMHGSKDVVDLVQNTPCAIGYSGLAYATERVKMPCVVDSAGTCVAPSKRTAIDGSYPIARPLFMYTDGAPAGPVREYMDWILSDEGQCIIAEKGYAPFRPVTCPGSAG